MRGHFVAPKEGRGGWRETVLFSGTSWCLRRTGTCDHMTQVLQLRLGDCIQRMKEIPEGSVEAIITDPPYLINFMSKTWDGADGDHIDWHRQWLTEAFRILRPDGVAKVFSATRTFHRLAAAMEEVGFVLDPEHSLLAWSYGCLAEDTEILTETGWKLGLEVMEGELVACWHPDTGTITLEAVKQIIRAPYKGDLVRFVNDNTDQLLTPNHRVYKKHRIREMVNGVRVSTEEADWTVQEAGCINRWNHLRLPLAGTYSGPGVGGPDLAALLGWVWTEGGFDRTGTGVRIYQSSVNQPYVDEIQSLLDKMVPDHKRYERIRTYKDREYTEFCWFFTGGMAKQVRSMLPNKQPTWELLWSMNSDEQVALVDAAIKGDGSTGSHQAGTFYQKDPEDLVWFQTLAHLMNRQGRINFKKHCVGLHDNPVTQFQGRHLKKDVREPYDGLVWCVVVPTGAFVARRKDKVFITGNSGFPKSLNVSKAFDAYLKTGKSDSTITGDASRDREGLHWSEFPRSRAQKDTWEPETPEAQLFDGYGTALKPAWEVFLVGKKPVVISKE